MDWILSCKLDLGREVESISLLDGDARAMLRIRTGLVNES